jgi:hypothetical protein
MKKKRQKSYTAALKVKIALEAIKGQRTINEIATRYGVHPSQAPQWKKQATMESARCLLDPARTRRPRGRSSQSGTLVSRSDSSKSKGSTSLSLSRACYQL